MNEDKVNSQSNAQTIKSNCSLSQTLNKPPYALICDNGVCYSYYEIDGDIIIEHKIKSETPLTETDIDLLFFLIERANSDGHLRLTGKELFGKFGYFEDVFDSLTKIKQIEIMNRITDTTSQKSAYHRFGIIGYYYDNRPYANASYIDDSVLIEISLYDPFVKVYLRHTIDNPYTSIDYIPTTERLADEKAGAEFLADNLGKRNLPPKENEIPEDDEADDDSDYFDDQEEDQTEDRGGLTVTIDDSQPILLSIRQLNRIYSTISEEDYEIKYGVLVKYRGKGGDIGIPSQVITIGKGAFEGCDGLKSISIPDTVKSIGKAAFKDCRDLVEVDIPLRLLKVVMTDIGAYFGGTQFVEYLARDGALWRRYEEVRKALEEEKMVGDEMEEENEEEDGEEEEK